MYYGASDSISSVYMWDLDRGFAGCWLIKKEIGSGRFLKRGCWDSIHVIEAVPQADAPSKFAYKLTSTVLLSMVVEKGDSTGTVDLSGSLTRQATGVQTVTGGDRGHVAAMGSLIEGMEGEMRSSMDALYIAKTREIVAGLHVRGATGAAIGGGAGARVGGIGVAGAMRLPGMGMGGPTGGVPMGGMGELAAAMAAKRAAAAAAGAGATGKS